MPRITSLFMVVALVSVTSLPMLPEAAICHAVEANATTENSTGKHGHAHMMQGSAMEMQRSMDHNVTFTPDKQEGAA